MSSWRFQINAGSGWIDLTDYNGRSLITRDSIEVRRDTHNKGKSVIDTIAFDIISPDQTLIQTLYNQKSYEPIDLLVDRDGDRYFTGYLRPVDDLEARAEGVAETTISVQGVDVLWKLQRTLDNDFSRTSETVDNIVRDLLELGGISTSNMVFSATLSQTVQEFQEEADDREILDILDDLLYEYHHNLAANPDGEIDLFNWLDPETSPVATFDESIDRIEARKTDDDYGYVSVSHWRFETVGNDDGTGLVTLHESMIRTLDSGETYQQDLALDFPIPDDAEILSISDLQIRFSITGAAVGGTAIYNIAGSRIGYRDVGQSEENTAMPRLRYGDGVRFDLSTSQSGNRAVSVSLRFAKNFRYNLNDSNEWEGNEYIVIDPTFTIRGKATYRQRSREQRASVSTAGALNARTERYDAEYIYSDTDGRSLAEAILQIRQYGSKKWTIRTASSIPIGSVVNVTAGPFGLTVRGRVQRITDSQSNATPDGLQEYVYLVETLESAAATSSSVSSTVPSLPAFPVAPSEISGRPTFDDIIEGVDETGSLQDLPAPALSATATTRKASLSVGYATALISGSMRVQLQISDDDTDWYSLGPGGNAADAWKGTLDDVTQIVGTAYTHDELPLAGTTGNPLQTTYYYRARIVSRGLVSDWSDSQAVMVSPVLEGDIGANSVTANKIAAGEVTASKIDVSDLFSQEITIGTGGYIKASNDAWRIDETSATIAGWDIIPDMIRSSDDTVRIRHDAKRFEIRNALDVVKVAFGYLGGITAEDGTAFDQNEFGEYFGPGTRVVMDSGAEYASGAYNINADAAFVVKAGGAEDLEAARLGALSGGDIGLDIGGMKFGELLGGGGASGTFETTVNGGGGASGTFENFVRGGGGARYGTRSGLLYSINENSLFLTGTLVGVDGEFSGTVRAGAVIGGTVEGALITGTRIEGAEIVGGSITGITIEGIDLSGTTIEGAEIVGGSINGAEINFGDDNFGIEINDILLAIRNAEIFNSEIKNGSTFAGTLKGVNWDLSLGLENITAISPPSSELSYVGLVQLYDSGGVQWQILRPAAGGVAPSGWEDVSAPAILYSNGSNIRINSPGTATYTEIG